MESIVSNKIDIKLFMIAKIVKDHYFKVSQHTVYEIYKRKCDVINLLN